MVSDQTRYMAVCTRCRVHWDADSTAKCTDPDHRHVDVHLHRSAVTLPDGTSVVAVSFDPLDPYSRDEPPAYGLYLDRRWRPPWRHEHVDWPDFGAPSDAGALAAALRSLLDRARAGQRVEIGCLGGHGRTGTALACLAVLCDDPSDEAVAWVRDNYCAAAVETAEQEAFAAGFQA